MSTANRVVIITGATCGLGSVAAQKFAKQGAWLVLVGMDMNKLTALARIPFYGG